jgi:prephenate dehydrogenase
VGSSKVSIVRAVEQASLDIPFVGSHPIAGSEQSGPAAGRADLYDKRMVVVTPTENTPNERLDEVERFWQCLGGHVRRMSPEDHDRTLAATSHVPHVVASALAAATQQNDLPYTGTGWGSTTRIAAGDPELWCDILLDNQTHALKSLVGFEQKLAAIRDALEHRDAEALRHLLVEGKKQRDSLGS